MSMLTKEFYEDPINFLREKFIAQRTDEFSKFCEAAKTREAVESKFRTLTNWVASKKVELGTLEEKLALYKNFEPGTTIFAAVKNHGAMDIENIARELLIPVLLKEHLPGAVALAREDLESCEKAFAKFKTEHAKLLKEIGLT